MAYALLDNATLTAVLRLFGVAASRSRDSVDADIAALENVVQAILFYDDVICLDDYKAEHRKERQQRFTFVDFLDPGRYTLGPIAEHAKRQALESRPKIVAGRFVDPDFQAFLEQLKMHIVCTWDISSSVHYLTMKMLGQPDTEEFEKYGKVSAAIFNELVDVKDTRGLNPYRNNALLVDSQGNEVGDEYRLAWPRWRHGETGGATPALRAFIASLNWVAFKTLYYLFAARYLKADVFLYPIRQSFAMRFMQKTAAYDSDFTQAVIARMNADATGHIEAVIGANRPASVSLDLPFFSAWLVRRTGSVTRVIDAALELRHIPPFTEAREQLRQLRILFDEQGLEAASVASQKLLKTVQTTIAKLQQDYGIGDKSGIGLTRLISVYNTFASLQQWPKLPELSAKIPLPKWAQEFPRRHGFALLYRSITKDLTDIPRLGDLREKLGASVVLHERGADAYRPKASDYEGDMPSAPM